MTTADIPARTDADIEADLATWRSGTGLVIGAPIAIAMSHGDAGVTVGVVARLLNDIPSLRARAQKAEVDAERAWAACSVEEAKASAANQLRRRCEKAESELAEAKAENERLTDLVAEFRKIGESQDRIRNRLTAERDAAVAKVQAVEAWAMVNEIAEPPLDWAGLRAALASAATPEPSEGEQQP